MRYLLIAAVLLVAGCGSDDDSPSTAPTPATTQAVEEEAATAYLDEIRGSLLGSYEDDELVALGSAFCDNLRAGRDSFTSGEPTGDGQYVFAEVSDPVWALDAVSAELAARGQLCPGA
jgi:hypothetical protein